MRNLIHVLLVAFIILLFISMVVDRGRGPRYPHVTPAKVDIANFTTALSMFHVDCGRYPTTEEGLPSLLGRPAGMPQSVNWHGPYLSVDKLPKDPWGRPYVFECPGKHNPDGFDVYSLGPKGKGGNEAIGNWTPMNR